MRAFFNHLTHAILIATHFHHGSDPITHRHSRIKALGFSLALCMSWAGFSYAEHAPNTADLGLPIAAQQIPTTNLIIDVPQSWAALPPEMAAIYDTQNWLDDGAEAEETLAAYTSSSSTRDMNAVILISRAAPLAQDPVTEMQLSENGMKLSRVFTWVVGSGMAIVRPTRAIEISDVKGATMTFLSGPQDAQDAVTLILLENGQDTLFIVDLAAKGSAGVTILDQMRASIRTP